MKGEAQEINWNEMVDSSKKINKELGEKKWNKQTKQSRKN